MADASGNAARDKDARGATICEFPAARRNRGEGEFTAEGEEAGGLEFDCRDGNGVYISAWTDR